MEWNPLCYRRKYKKVIRELNHHLLENYYIKNRSSTIKRPLMETREGRICRRRSEKIFPIRSPSGWNGLSYIIKLYLDEFDLFIEKLISIQHSTTKDITQNRNTKNSH